MATATPQVVYGLFGGLADDVPKRDFDGRYGTHMDLGAIGVNVADHPLRNDLHLERVHTDDERLEFMDGGLDGFGEIVEGSFADAVNAFVGGDLRKEPVLPWVAGYVGVDGCYAH